MLKKITQSLKRKKLRRDARTFARLMSEYELNLGISDKFGVSSDITSNDNLYHFLRNRSLLDGRVGEIINRLPPGKVAIDIGANIGLVSAMLAKKFETVYAFEPERLNAEKLRKTARMNDVTNIRVFESVVSNQPGELDLFVSDSSSHHSLGIAHDSHSSGSKIKVPATTLDEFLENQRIEKIDLLKVDVEGFEPEVFEGAKESFAKGRIEQVILEISRSVIEKLNRDLHECPKLLIKNGFRLESFDGKPLEIEDLKENISDQDILAVKIQKK